MITEARLAALRAMANQDVSPNERDIAKAKLLEMGAADREPPSRPPAAPAPAMPGPSYWTTGTSTTANVWFVSAITFVSFRG